jgi:hypothetical protein
MLVISQKMEILEVKRLKNEKKIIDD